MICEHPNTLIVFTRQWWRPWHKKHWLRCWWCNMRISLD